MDSYNDRKIKNINKQIILWEKMIMELFKEKPDEVREINDKDEIVEILNSIGMHKASNHTFLPSGGGLDLISARKSFEKDKIELDLDGMPHIVKPKSLKLYVLDENPEWWYFKLNTSTFNSTDIYNEVPLPEKDIDIFNKSSEEQLEWRHAFRGEELVELEPEKYVNRDFWDLNHYGNDQNGNETEYPRLIVRGNNGGSFVIFSKLSTLNKLKGKNDAYGGLHNMVNDEDYNSYLKNLIENIKE